MPGVRGHERDLEKLFWLENLDVLCLQDTRLPSDAPWNRRCLSMECIRFHSSNVAGGLAILYRPGLECTVKRLAKEGCAAIRVRLEDEEVWIACCYARPHQVGELEQISAALAATEEERGDSLLVAIGDFNAKFRGEFSPKTDAHGEQVNLLSSALGLRRLPSSSPTTEYGSAIDHCLVSWELDAAWQRVERNTANSDHFPMVCTLRRQKAPLRASEGRCWKAHRFPEQRERISGMLTGALPSIEISADPTEEEVSKVYQVFLDQVHSILSKTVGVSRRRRLVPTDPVLGAAIRRRDALSRKISWKCDPARSEELREQLKEARDTAQKVAKEISAASFKSWQGKLATSQPGPSLQMVSSCLRNRREWTPPPTRLVHERLERLMGRRESRFARQKEANAERDAGRARARAPSVSREEVVAELRACNPKKAQGQDDVPAWLLHGCAEELATWLCRFFSALFRAQVVPFQWLKGRTILLAKDSSGDPSKFRPVTLLSRVRILFEKLLYRRILPLMPTHPLQGGFKAGHQCHHWSGILHDALRARTEQQKPLLVVTLDCTAAFDTVSHSAIAAGVPECPWRNLVLNLVEFQRLRLHGSDLWLHPQRGTPQGGVLSPLLFNRATDGVQRAVAALPKVSIGGLQVNCLQWADDTMLLARTEEDMASLIRAVKAEWARCGLRANPAKSKLLAAGLLVPEVEGIRSVESLEYLGVTFRSTGVWEAADFDRRRAAARDVAGKLRGIGLRRGGLPVQVRMRIAKAFLVPRADYGAPLYRVGAGGIPRETLRKADSELVQWVFGTHAAREAGLVLLGRAPFEVEVLWARERLRRAARPAPVAQIAWLDAAEDASGGEENLLLPRRGRLGGHRAPKGAIWAPETAREAEWTPSTKTGRQATHLDRRAMRRLPSAQQALVAAFAVNQFPGGRWRCTRGGRGERVTRGHLERCPCILLEAPPYAPAAPLEDLPTLVAVLQAASRCMGLGQKGEEKRAGEESPIRPSQYSILKPTGNPATLCPGEPDGFPAPRGRTRGALAGEATLLREAPPECGAVEGEGAEKGAHGGSAGAGESTEIPPKRAHLRTSPRGHSLGKMAEGRGRPLGEKRAPLPVVEIRGGGKPSLATPATSSATPSAGKREGGKGPAPQVQEGHLRPPPVQHSLGGKQTRREKWPKVVIPSPRVHRRSGRKRRPPKSLYAALQRN